MLLDNTEFTSLAPDYCFYPKNTGKTQLIIKAYRYKTDYYSFIRTEYY